MSAAIFITGATGFLGAQIARRLLDTAGGQLFVLVRAADAAAARQRLKREWWDMPELRAALETRIQAVPGDLLSPRFGLKDEEYHRLAARITHIVHAAADIRLFAPLAELRRVNVGGSQQVLEFARAVQADHGLERLAHISTAYVAGRRKGLIREEDLDCSAGFFSPYEQSKAEAEILVRQAGAGLPISIFRPGMIVGDSRSGEIKTFNTIYLPLKLYLTGRLAVAPAVPSARVNLVPVDYVAGAVARLLFEPRAAGKTFHLTPPGADSPTQAQLGSFTRAWAKRELGLELPRPRFFPLPDHPLAARLFAALLGPELASFARLLPYFQPRNEFDRSNCAELLGPYPHRWPDLLGPLLAYAVECSFWQRAPRTVHEQILHRLQSKSRPVVYHDLYRGRESVRGGPELRAEILALVQALRAQGLAAGDRLAIVGQNHSRYFSVLVACGLAGVVVVPLYATAPPAEIESLLRDCAPKLFLVGPSTVAARLDEIELAIPLVSIDPAGPPPDVRRAVLSWEAFLAQAPPEADPELPLLPFDAPAAIYYTSGTTGQPKGLVYQHAQLRWLAYTLASLYPWRERHRQGAYLSYLPMNHVVEGILATYSPYYAPAALDIYFLAEFSELPQALKRSRPTIFFSVPRFFEKVRAAFLENRLARVYSSLPPGPARRWLRPLLRRGLLRKSGLDGCRQMIVGSAPSAPELLAFFQELGIEVHNAYGLTEAPLVTLNRLGRNQPHTLGEPLPDTQISLSADGEISIRGPQVAPAAWENGQVTPLPPGGWLASGDLGVLSPDGHLTIFGRKKDILVTAYGSNIFPAPIEARLRAIPGIGEALLIGDGRSFCSALLWPESASGTISEETDARIRAGVGAVNARLSHAEQIKSWAILPEPLSILDGSLTGSLKLKRAVLSTRYAALIAALYAGEAAPPGVVFAAGERSEHNEHSERNSA